MTRVGWIRSLVACAVLALGTTVARAEFATGSTVTEVSGNFTSNSTDDGSAINAFDGVYVFDKTTNTGQTAIVQVDATFVAGQTRLQVIIYTGTVANAYLGAVLFLNTSTGEYASWTATDASTEGLLGTSTGNVFTFDPSGSGTYGLTLSSNFSTYDQITINFEYKNNNDRLQFDALANPEPASFALYLLGAAGLAYGVRARRRRRQTAAARKPA